MRIQLIILCVFQTCFCYSTLSEEYHIQPINNQEALPSKIVNCILQDSEGYIWLGTSEGLCRYDGYSIKTFKSSHQNPYLLKDDMVVSLAEDGNGLLWIGTISGMNVYNKKTGKLEKVISDKLANIYTGVVYYSRRGQMWIGTDTGLYLYDEESDTFRQIDFSSPGNPTITTEYRIRSLCEDIYGNMWAGTFDEGLFKIDAKTYGVIGYPKFSKHNHVSAIFEDKDGNMWMGAWGEGVYKVLNRENPSTTTYIRMDTNTRYERLIYSIMQDEDGNILLGTGLGLDIIASPYTPAQYRSSENEKLINIPNNEIRSLYRDKNGIIWIATKGNGVYQFFEEKKVFTNHLLETIDDLNQPASVNGFYEWEDDILIGIDKIGIARFNKGSQQIHTSQYDKDLQKIPFPMGNIRTIFKHPEKEELYLGSEYGGFFVCKLDGKEFRSCRQFYNSYPYTSDWLTGDVVQSIFYDREKNIWIGVNAGFNIITARGDTLKYNYQNMGKRIICQSIIEDKKGQIWIGTNHNGIIRVDKSRGANSLVFHEYTLENSRININNVKCLYQDIKGLIFAGTKGGGLCIYDEQNDCFERVKGMDGFNSDDILSIIESDQYLYMGTNQGLIQFNPYGEENKQLMIFTESDGLLDNTFNANAVMKGKDGTLYFGTPRGFISFDPAKIEVDILSENLVISDIKIFNNSFDNLPEKQRQNLSPDYHPTYSKRIILSHKDYNFGIEFATLSYKHPDKNRYAYMLEGFDKEWNYVSASNRSAYYTNMKSGTYRFMVKGTNENSFMNSVPEILEIVVLPPPYKSWWAYLIYTVIFVCVLYIVVRMLLYRTRMKMLDIEYKKNEELTQEKLKFFTDISHEFLTPLTIINCSVEELQQTYNDYGSSWRAIKGNIFRLIKLLEQILEFRKAEKGKLKLNVTYGDAGTFLIDLCKDNFQHYGQDKSIEFAYNSVHAHIPAWFDKNIIDMVMFNLLSNAFKYNEVNGKVYVDIKAEEQTTEFSYRYLKIKVGNTGAGFTAKQLNELFQRFQSFSYAGHEKQGNGIGLYLTKTLIELHKGTIDVTSNPSEWTEFTVSIPIDKEFYFTEIEQQKFEAQQTTIIHTMVDRQTEQNVEKMPYSLLIIEDDSELLASMTRLLSKSFTVISATDGKSAFHMAQEQNPDLIISDVLLPEMNGFDLCRMVKQDLSVSHIPVILLTAKISPTDKVYGFESGADAYITKPFRFDVLYAQIRSLLMNRKNIIDKFKQNEQLPTKPGENISPDQQFFNQAVGIIEKNMDNPDFAIQSILEEMNISNSMLYRKLKALTGLSPNDFIRNIRLKKACGLLLDNHYNISEIAYKVGFNDAKYFSICFKKEFGLTPSEYRVEKNSL